MLYLGIDAGATKTKAVLLTPDFQKVSEAQAEGANAAEIGIKKALKNVEKAVQELSPKFNGSEIKACFAIAGVDSDPQKRTWENAIEKSPKLGKIKSPLILNDTRAAIRTASISKNAIVAIAGTGSNCYGFNEEGHEAKAGGGSYILGDEGSGYYIGLRILKAVHRSLDGRGPETRLKDDLFKHFKIKNRVELISLIYGKPWQKPDIAQVAQLIEKPAKLGDKTAIKILDDAVDEIALMITTVAGKLSLKNKKYDLVMTGSVFKIEEHFKEKIQKQIKNFSKDVVFQEPIFDSATAAAHLAAESN